MDIINWLIANHITLPVVVALLYLIVISTKKDGRIFWKLYSWLKSQGVKLPTLTKKDE